MEAQQADGKSAGGKAAARDSAGAADYRLWGERTLDLIERAFRVKGSALYHEAIDRSGKFVGRYGPYSFVWPASFQLRALAAAARVDKRRYAGRLTGYAKALDSYVQKKDGQTAYMVLTSRSERFYDDNAWLLIGLMETYELTRDGRQLRRAEHVMKFLLSGEGRFGQIPQKEAERGSHYGFTCTVAPTAVGALMLHEKTKDKRYLAAAKRYYAWLTDPKVGVQDPASGLYHQGATWGGEVWRVKRGYRAYQTALPMQAAVRLHRITKDPAYLREARRLAASCIARWVDKDTGALGETAQWGGSDLCDALLDLHEVDGDPRWPAAVSRVLRFLHAHARGPEGFFPEDWNRKSTGPAKTCHLMHQAAAARAFWRAAHQQQRSRALARNAWPSSTSTDPSASAAGAIRSGMSTPAGGALLIDLSIRRVPRPSRRPTAVGGYTGPARLPS